MTPATFVPRDPTTGEVSFSTINYQAVFNNEAFLRAIVNSTIVAVTVTVLALAIGAFAGFALGKLRYRGKNATLYIILAMTMFPQIAVLTGLYSMITAFGISAIPSLIITYLLFSLPFTAWVLTAFFKETACGDLPVSPGRWRLALPDLLYDHAAAHSACAGHDRSAGFHRGLE